MRFRSSTSGRGSALAVFIPLLMIVGACGSGDEGAGGGVASLTDDGTGPSAGADAAPDDTGLEAPENPEDAFALFGECMTDAGFDFGEAISVGGGDGSGGAITVEPGGTVLGNDEIDPQQQGGSLEEFDLDAFDEANEACEGHLANIDGGFDLSPEQEAAFEDAQLEWSRCMEEQGIEVPEVDGSGGAGVVIVEGPVGDADPQGGSASFEDLEFDFEGFEEAAELCQSVYDQYDELDGLFDEGQVNG